MALDTLINIFGLISDNCKFLIIAPLILISSNNFQAYSLVLFTIKFLNIEPKVLVEVNFLFLIDIIFDIFSLIFLYDNSLFLIVNVADNIMEFSSWDDFLNILDLYSNSICSLFNITIWLFFNILHDSIKSLISIPYAPALPYIEPPIVPGIPANDDISTWKLAQ